MRVEVMIGGGRMEPDAGWSDEVVEFVKREANGAVALS
jgi:hypothetical protein